MADGTSTGSDKKKGLSPIAWVAIGCAGILIVGAIGVSVLGIFAVKKAKEFADDPVAMAEAAINFAPDYEVTDRDDEAGTLTYLNEKTGESFTVNYSDIREGRFSFESSSGESVSFDAQSEDGTMKVVTDQGETTYGAGADEAPDWVPRHEGATRSQSLMHNKTQGAESGTFVQWTPDDAKVVLDAYEARLRDDGYEVSRHTTSAGAGGGLVGLVNGVSKELGRTINVALARDGDETRLNITYTEKPPAQ